MGFPAAILLPKSFNIQMQAPQAWGAQPTDTFPAFNAMGVVPTGDDGYDVSFVKNCTSGYARYYKVRSDKNTFEELQRIEMNGEEWINEGRAKGYESLSLGCTGLPTSRSLGDQVKKYPWVIPTAIGVGVLATVFLVYKIAKVNS